MIDEATKETISIGIAEGVKNSVIIDALGVSDQNILDVMQEENKYFESLERREELERVAQSIKEWAEEFPKEWRDERRREYLLTKIEEVRKEFFDGCIELAEREDDLTYWSEQHLQSLEKQLWRMGMELKILSGKEEGITPERIAFARKHPITDFVQHRNFMALCPFHKERTPSMNIRNNYFYCHGCGETGDVIDYVMKTQNLPFRKAIEMLL